MRGNWITTDNFYEDQSMYLEIARKSFNGEEYKQVKKQFIESRHPLSKKYDEDEELSNLISKIQL